MKTAQDWIKLLKLKKHPEGGYFKEVYRASEQLKANSLPARFNSDHCFSTSIYYLLQNPDFSAFHRIKQDEIWHFYQGSSLTIHIINKAGEYTQKLLGSDPGKGQSLQHIVMAGDWFAATVNQVNDFSLMGCTVSPGFEFEDFEMASDKALAKEFPQHHQITKRLCRSSISHHDP